MNEDADLRTYVSTYRDEVRHDLFPRWNPDSAPDEANDVTEHFRAHVAHHVLAEPESAPLALVRDLFVAETQFAAGACGVSDHFAPIAALLLTRSTACADWPTVRGDVARSGLVREELRPPFRLAWVRHFQGERLGSAAEPIVAGGQVFIATHQGNLYATETYTGARVQRFLFKGVRPVTRTDQGVPWPARR